MHSKKSSRACSGCGQPFEPSRPYHRRCWSCWGEHDRGRSTETREPGAGLILDARTIRAALALAHPDRHPPERAEQATRVTQALSVALTHAREREAV